MSDQIPRMYGDLADWFHLLTAPQDYAEEATFYLEAARAALGAMPRTVLELGAGGGNNAWHYKHAVEHVTLTDLAPRMLALSATINPECAHVHGDMRSLRLGRTFDFVFVHDAVSYLTSQADLRACLVTAFAHTRAGGVALFAPDHVRENFYFGADSGGHDGDDGRAMRFLEWTYDPDPDDEVYSVDYSFVLHEPRQPPRAVLETHVCGLFARADWLRLLGEVGFEPTVLPFEHSEVPSGSLEVFVARKPAE